MILPLKSKVVVDQSAPLAEFIENCYLPWTAEHFPKSAGKKSWKTRVNILRHVAKLFPVYLRRPAVVGDLNLDTIAPFLEWCAKFTTFQQAPIWREVRRLMQFLRYVPDGRKEKSGRPKRPLSEATDTLWGICVGEFFLKNRRIRSDKTRHQYKVALADFKTMLGRDAVLNDLDDDSLNMLAKHLEEKGLAEKTVNERCGRVVSLWGWLAKRRRVEMFPDFQRLPVPRRMPRAWKPDELARLFASCLLETGEVVQGIDGAAWWFSLHSAIYDCGERVGAMLQARWEWYDAETGLLEMPAEARKGRTADMLHPFHTDTRAVLERMRAVGHELIWPWPCSEVMLYRAYNRILRRAGLDPNRKNKFHKMRRTTATYLQARGIDAGLVLGHTDPRVTRDSYLDLSQIVQRRVCDVLPRPQELIDGIAKLPAPEKPLLRLEYRAK